MPRSTGAVRVGAAGRRPRASVVAALLTLVLAVGCSGGKDGGGDDGAGGGAKRTAGSPAPDTSISRSPGSSSGAPELPSSLTSQRLKWGDCRATDGAPPPGRGWQCATVKAPLDYAKPDGATIDLALIRSRATGGGERIGSLLFNFGGPGVSGVALLPQLAEGYSALHKRYDLVSFDPRGVAGSEGLRCRSDRQTQAAEASVDLTPDTPAEEKAFLKDASAFKAGCERDSGKLLPHLSTADAARDLDLTRHALGDRKLRYFGISYGTELGGTYAHLFPKNVGRLILDGVVDPTADSVTQSKNQAKGFQRALNNYLRSTGADPAAGTAKIAALLKRLDAKPLPTGGERRLNQSLATTGIVLALYSKETWPPLTRALEDAESGDGSALLNMADAYNERDSSGHYSTAAHAQRAISCADDRQRPTAEEARKTLDTFRAISPAFGEFLGWDTAGWCHDWPVRGEHDTPEVSAPGAAPIVVVGNTGDPATPYEGARAMADELGKGVGVELTYKGEGHGAYGSGSDCVDSTVDTYLLEGTVPKDGKVCE
ncbi:alpha/beta hydrolase [Streptomyces tsukubensis]|uniref:Peptidase n=1 Tax=Streptomyces tsukubensis TaxID=83656 RepID=A0A1V4ABM7_9ACTN|nr:alpha/beta hydrolase [Streptomyces tsukubensis]OON81278.1 peptidase [Streptomyces tsukubensis]QFR95609.1 alpha/beta fold hydrolase [Streptomyces tsukubensis]